MPGFLFDQRSEIQNAGGCCSYNAWKRSLEHLLRRFLYLVEPTLKRSRRTLMQPVVQLLRQGKKRIVGKIRFPGTELDHLEIVVLEPLGQDVEERGLARTPRAVDCEDTGPFDRPKKIRENLHRLFSPEQIVLERILFWYFDAVWLNSYTHVRSFSRREAMARAVVSSDSVQGVVLL